MDASRCRYPPLCSSDELVLRLSKLTPLFLSHGPGYTSLPPNLEVDGEKVVHKLLDMEGRRWM